MHTIDTGLESTKYNLQPLQGRWGFLWVSICFACLTTFYFFWAYANMFNSFMDTGSMFERGEFSRTDGIIQDTLGNVFHFAIAMILNSASVICAIIAVCLFYHKASKNLHMSGLTGLSYTPGMAVGWFFIPFANLVLPLLVTNEIWKGSVAVSRGESGAGWRNHSINPFIIVWYLAFILGLLYYFFSMIYVQMNMVSSILRNPDGDPIEHMRNFIQSLQIVFFGYAFTWLIQGISLIFFTRKIVELQKQV